MSSESENKDSPKLPTKLAVHISLKAQKEKNEELDEELKLAQEIFADQEYEKSVENSGLQYKIKRSFWNRGLSLKLMISSKRT